MNILSKLNFGAALIISALLLRKATTGEINANVFSFMILCSLFITIFEIYFIETVNRRIINLQNTCMKSYTRLLEEELIMLNKKFPSLILSITVFIASLNLIAYTEIYYVIISFVGILIPIMNAAHILWWTLNSTPRRKPNG